MTMLSSDNQLRIQFTSAGWYKKTQKNENIS